MSRLAVVLSGGGAKGAFQVGALQELVVERGVDFSIFAGVSTGAIQALGGAQDDIPGLVAAWLALKGNRDVYRPRPGGLVGGLLGNDSIYDARPIHARIKAFADPVKLRSTGKRLLLGVTNLTTGRLHMVADNAADIADWVYASSAMPVFFRPFVSRAADGREEQWVDGGVRDVTPLGDTLKQRPTAILVISASPLSSEPVSPRAYRSLVPVALRSIGILQSEVVRTDTSNADLINALLAAQADQRRIMRELGLSAEDADRIAAPFDEKLKTYGFAPIRLLAPQKEVAETLEFDPARIRAGIEAGRQAVRDAWPTLKLFLGG